MANKKDFTNTKEKVSTTLQNAIADATIDDQERTPSGRRKYKTRAVTSPERIAEAQENLQTSGLKGAKLQRINMGFSNSNWDYIHVMAQVTGMSITQFVNAALAQHRESHAEMYEQALAFREQIKKGI